MMEQTFKFFTDTATLAAFDPQQLEHRVDDNADWWCLDFSELDEVQAGAIALVSLGSDGVYQVRVTDQDLIASEREYAAEVVSNLGVAIVSGKLFIGPGECLPGGKLGFVKSNLNRGILCEVENGTYRVDVYAIHWHDSPRWWTDNQEAPEGAPSDFVVVLRLRDEPMPRLTSEPRFDGISDSFLFDSPAREIGPRPGMVLTTMVRRGPDGLCLKDCGPNFYAATLLDYSGVEWKDTIRFKVVAVDHERKSMTGEFIEKVAIT